MLRGRRNDTRRAALALAIAIGLLVLGASIAAFATHSPCDDEGFGGGDVGNNFGPDVLVVGVDTPSSSGGLNNGAVVCASTGEALPPNDERVYVAAADPDPARAGATVAATRESCTPVCQPTPIVGQTGVEAPDGAITDLPGGGTVGAAASLNGLCTWSNGAQDCQNGGLASVTAWESDLPQTEEGCLFDVEPPPGCAVNGPIEVTLFGDEANATVRVSTQGLPAGNDDIDIAPQKTCVAVGQPCD